MKENTDKNMYHHIKELFPKSRSILGPGIREALDYFERINPELKRITWKTGEKVGNWPITYFFSSFPGYSF